MSTASLRAACSAPNIARLWQARRIPRARLSPPQHSSRSKFVASHALSRRPLHTTSGTGSLQSEPEYKDKVAPSDVLDTFPRRHIGPSADSVEQMLKALDPPAQTIDEFVKQVIPPDVLSSRTIEVGTIWPDQNPAETGVTGVSETDLLRDLRLMVAEKNHVGHSFLGQGYYGTKVPEVIKRNILENPAWYTSYTPYQPEISQGRLESLLNFQTMVTDLTGLPIANASVLDEATAAAEAMTLSMGVLPMSRQKREKKTFLVSSLCHPQTIAVLHSRAEGFGIKIEVGEISNKRIDELGDDLVGVLAQYPNTEGGVEDFQAVADKVHEKGSLFSVATDLLALTLLKPPGEFGADIAFGNAQRFGVPLGYGGPHAAFFAVAEKYKRKIPGRLIGMSKDRLGNPAARLALQTREQHIRREKATSNICTAQALLANMSAMYAVYHGPNGLKEIARRVVATTRGLQNDIIANGFKTGQRGKMNNEPAPFDTFVVETGRDTRKIIDSLKQVSVYVRQIDENHIAISCDETTSQASARHLSSTIMRANDNATRERRDWTEPIDASVPAEFERTSPFLTHPVFNTHHSETEMLRYIHHLESKDLSLVHSMIPLGSCTMKLNATTQMVPISWPEFANLHPFVPVSSAQGYQMLIKQLEDDLANITGFDAVSLQPNSGAQGEFTGLRVIRKYLEQQPGKKRDICLIPVSAHGTNPASAAMCGMRVIPIKCETSTGNLDMEDLKMKCEKYSEELGAIMVTYPSTFGVFEPKIKEVCSLIHKHGGQVYMDGANMNAQIGLCSPGEIGADVCHLNLHKTFCIPHGGGGPGVGPIAVKEHLETFLPGHLRGEVGGANAIQPVSAAPWGSASILPISWAYIKMMGAVGLTQATKVTLVSANYILSRLKPHYPILYTNDNGRCAHEFILDVRKFKETTGIEAIDVAKRLQDYGFHAPTMSWPVANTLMIEPTESENKAELDRFCDALISIRKEIAAIEKGEQPKEGNVMKMSPHTQQDLIMGEWDRPYTREQAAYPLPYLKQKKFWPTVTRIDDAYGDTNLFCTCAPVEDSEDITGAAAPTPT